MPLTRPSAAFSDKTNVNPSINRQQEATAEDFMEAGALFDEYATAIEGLQQEASANPYYGSYTTLVALQTAHPTALTDGWAIIDAGAGITPQIAAWDDIEEQWELAGGTSQVHVFVNTVADLPGTGVEQKDYITLDDMQVRVWHNGEYKIKSPINNTTSWQTKIVKTLDTDGNTDPVDATQGNILLVNASSNITYFVFDSQFSKVMAKVQSLATTKNFGINIFNVTENTNLRAVITSFELVNSDANLKIGVSGITTSEVAVGHVLQLELPHTLPDYQKLAVSEYNDLYFDTSQNANPLEFTDGNHFYGHPEADKYVVGRVIDAASFDPYDTSKAKLFIDSE